jgi:hypothetical protein
MVDMLAVLVVLVIFYAGLKAFTYSNEHYDCFDKGAK